MKNQREQWVLEPHGEHGWAVASCDGDYVAYCPRGRRDGGSLVSRETQMRRARLIAFAPELLRTIKAIRRANNAIQGSLDSMITFIESGE